MGMFDDLPAEDRETIYRAQGIQRRAYYEEIASIAREILKSHPDATDTSVEGLDEEVWETVDGHQFVIYTWQSKKVLEFSDNDEIGWDEGLVSHEDCKDGIPWAKLAFCAMRADVNEEIASQIEKRDEGSDATTGNE
jgi:hypothetical protein